MTLLQNQVKGKEPQNPTQKSQLFEKTHQTHAVMLRTNQKNRHSVNCTSAREIKQIYESHIVNSTGIPLKLEPPSLWNVDGVDRH